VPKSDFRAKDAEAALDLAMFDRTTPLDRQELVSVSRELLPDLAKAALQCRGEPVGKLQSP
jgi:hypothetical protein